MSRKMQQTPSSLSFNEVLDVVGEGTLMSPHPSLITGATTLASATSSDASFLHHFSYIKSAAQSCAGLLIVTKAFYETLAKFCESSSSTSIEESSQEALRKRNYLIVDHPLLAFQRLYEYFHPPFEMVFGETLDPSASIHPTAEVSQSAHIGPGCVIGPRCRIGAHSKLIANVTCYSDVTMGEECLIHAGVVIREGCELGNRVILQPSAVIGSCGFGYHSTASGHKKLPQIAPVIIEDDVEIGASATIDRGHFTPTRIGEGTKIDNLVQIGHGVIVGPNNLMAAQSGIAGSTTTGSWVTLAGQCGLSGHIEVASGVTIAAQAGVTKSIKESGLYGGSPAQPMNTWRRQEALLRRLPQIKNSLDHLMKSEENPSS